MRILLVPPKSNYPDPKPYVGLEGQGFPYIAAALKKAGHEVAAAVMSHEWCTETAPARLAFVLEAALREYQPHVVGVGGLSADYGFVRDAVSFIRRSAPDAIIVCGGGMVTYDREFIFGDLRPDFAVSGEAEDTIVKLVNCLESGGNVRDVPNIAYWENGSPKYTRVELPETALEDLPFPDYELFRYEASMRNFNQIETWYAHTRSHPRIMPISMGRSCPFKCTFCVHSHTLSSRYRQRSIDSAIEEIVHFYDRFQFNILFIYDELFAVDRKRVSEFCTKLRELKVRHGMDFDWTCDLRVGDADEDMLREMKDAGCVFIGYGLESASQTVLTSMNKKTTVDQIERALRLTVQAGIGFQGNFIFGDIEETTETAEETLRFFMERCKDLIVFLGPVAPYPGSKIFEYSVANGLIKDKPSYYEQIGPLGQCRINMTKMPEDVYLNTINRVNGILGGPITAVEHALGLKKARITSHSRTSELADPALPSPARRPLYDVQALCPHCHEMLSYLCPSTSAKTIRPRMQLTYCLKCHKRLILLLGPLWVARLNKDAALSLSPRFMRPGLTGLYHALVPLPGLPARLKNAIRRRPGRPLQT